jgi:hypothetical protein
MPTVGYELLDQQIISVWVNNMLVGDDRLDGCGGYSISQSMQPGFSSLKLLRFFFAGLFAGHVAADMLKRRVPRCRTLLASALLLNDCATTHVQQALRSSFAARTCVQWTWVNPDGHSIVPQATVNRRRASILA